MLELVRKFGWRSISIVRGSPSRRWHRRTGCGA